jgi:hypothetical protein
MGLRAIIFGVYSGYMPEDIPKVGPAQSSKVVTTQEVPEFEQRAQLVSPWSACPDCGTLVFHASACAFCPTCGWGRCG